MPALYQGPCMNQIEEFHRSGFHTAVLLSDKEIEAHVEPHAPSLEEIRRRACEIHHEHGAVSGGYTLDDWLEAEHELDEEGPGRMTNQVH